MKKRLLSAFLAVMMVLTMAPMAFAADNGDDAGSSGAASSTAVAKIGDVEYPTLQAAVDAAKSGQTVQLVADTKENVTISKQTVVLDLNGYTLNGGTEAGKPALTINNKTVTIQDSSENQTGTIKREDTAENSGKTSHYVIDIQGKNGFLKFLSGNVVNDSGTEDCLKGSSLIRLGNDQVSGAYPTLTIKGGTFTQNRFIAIKVDRGTLHFIDGTVNCSDSYAIENWNNAYIKGGTVNGTVASWVYSTGAAFSKLEISNGMVNGNVYAVNYDNATDKIAKVFITGGTITGDLGLRGYTNHKLVPIADESTALIDVTGGTFTKDPTAYLGAGAYISSTDGKYEVAKSYLAKIDDTGYYTMDDAFHAVTAGQTITMQRDYTTNALQNSGDKSFTIDLNGYTWTCTGDDSNSGAFEINYSNVTLTVKNGKVVSDQLIGLIPSAMSGKITYDNSGLVFENVNMTTNAHSGFETNGNNTNDTIVLRNSTLNVPNGYGIYFPSSGSVTLENSKINAKTMGVQVCAGSLNVKDSDVTVTGGPVTKTENDGAIEDGAAISIVDRTGYKGLGNVAIESGKFAAKFGNDAVKAYKWENKTASAFDNSNKTIAITGGYFTTNPHKYVAEGYTEVTSDKSGYDCMVVQKTDTDGIDVESAVGAPEVTVSSDISEADQKKVKEAAETASASTLSIAAADEAQKIDKDKAAELKNKASTLSNPTLYVQTALSVTPTEYNDDTTKGAKKLVLDITPQYRIVASTVDDAEQIELDGDDKNAEVVQGYKKLEITKPTTVTMQLPTGFVADGVSELSVKHTHDGKTEYYTGTVETVTDNQASAQILTFTTNGFSPFEISEIAAKIGEIAYPTLKDAVDNVRTGDTIKLVKDVASNDVATVAKNINFKVDTNNKQFDKDKNIVAGSYTTAKVTGDASPYNYEFTYTKPSSGGSSGGSSSGSGSNTFSVTTSAVDNGGVNASPSKAAKGKTVTITLSPDKGYKLDKLTVTDGSGKAISTTKKSDTVYTFTMPASQVKVGVSYVKIASEPEQTTGYADVAANDWFADAVQYVSDKGMMNGTGKNTFGPQLTTTRGMIVTVLYRLEKEPQASAASFTDVASGEYYANAVAWANANGIVSGYGNGKFGPNDTITREQLAAILYRYAQFKKYDVSVGENTNILSYTDAQSVSSYAVPAMQWACGAGVVTGKTGGKLDPKGGATRAEVAAMLMRFCENVK